MVVIRPQPQFDQSTGIRHGFALPAMICLVLLKRFLRGIVPFAGRLCGQVVLAYEGFLNFLRSLGIDLLLAATPRTGRFLILLAFA